MKIPPFPALCLAATLFLLVAAPTLAQESMQIDVAKFQYEGQSPDAPWRAEAAERIEKYRKGDLTVTVVDEAGRPVADADIEVRMTRHAFKFGTQLNHDVFLNDTEDGRRYRAEFLRLFNYATTNWFYYMQWKTSGRADAMREKAYAGTKWLAEHDIPMRGHVLVWYFKDENIEKGEEDVRARAMRHIEQTAGDPIFAARIDEWDVQNEPYQNSDIHDLLGKESMPAWFRRVRELDPDAKLFLNEAGLASRMHRPDWAERVQETHDLVKYLQEQGTPIDGLGLQSHHIESLASIPKVIETLDRFAELGLPLQVTEYDIKLVPAETDKRDYKSLWRAPAPTSPELEDLEGQYMRDYLTACFSHPAMDAFIMWGFWDGNHWLYNAPIFRKDWTLKPQGRAYIDLVLGEWRTNVDGRTQADGTLDVRGFLGDYEITASKGDRTTTIDAKLVREGTDVKVVLRNK